MNRDFLDYDETISDIRQYEIIQPAKEIDYYSITPNDDEELINQSKEVNEEDEDENDEDNEEEDDNYTEKSKKKTTIKNKGGVNILETEEWVDDKFERDVQNDLHLSIGKEIPPEYNKYCKRSCFFCNFESNNAVDPKTKQVGKYPKINRNQINKIPKLIHEGIEFYDFNKGVNDAYDYFCEHIQKLYNEQLNVGEIPVPDVLPFQIKDHFTLHSPTSKAMLYMDRERVETAKDDCFNRILKKNSAGKREQNLKYHKMYVKYIELGILIDEKLYNKSKKIILNNKK